ncbi:MULTISPECIES: hypothetical protein [Niastella]|uniref:Outer membrane protein beta-barrel domain-containing protein n=1 Tax=Niastella soli TaxID=2821487 RepID=A0ABS3YMF0_9BACT|nr:hypothetical protein [Niastella soli]MBO9199055.1 hypothetical protein [Niastella soli]
MKRLLTISIFFLPALLFAQQKTGSFIKEHLYVKVSPALVFSIARKEAPQNGGGQVAPAIFGAAGAKIRYAALGFSAGYFNLKEIAPVTLPIGADLTITDFKAKKAFPVITAQWHKAHSTENYGSGHYYYNISGKDLFSIGAGVSFRILKTTKIQTTLSYSKLSCDAKVTYVNGPNRSDTYYKSPLEMAVLAASIVL